MKKILTISISILLILIVLICFSILNMQEDKEKINDKDNINDVNDVSIKEDDLKDDIINKEQTNTNTYFYKSWNKISVGQYYHEIEQLKKASKWSANGVGNKTVTVEDDNINFVGTSFASSKIYEDGFRIVTRQEALQFINDNSDIQSSVETAWYNENFKEGMIYMIISSGNFNPEFAAFPEFRYSLEENTGYLVFKKSSEHYYVNLVNDSLKEIIKEKSKATYTVIAIDSLEKFNNIKVIIPQQFEKEEEKFNSNSLFIFSDGAEYAVEQVNNMQVLKNDIVDLKAVSISSLNQNPKGVLIMNEERVKKFLKENSSEVGDEFFGDDRIYVLLSSDKFEPESDVGIRVAYDESRKNLYISCKSKDDVKESNDFKAAYMLMSLEKEKIQLLSEIKIEFKRN